MHEVTRGLGEMARTCALAIGAALMCAAFMNTHASAGPAATSAPALATVKQPRELGAVPWMRDFESARQASRSSGRPMLVLFDEVPGCHTCVSYGEQALSHPLIVDAAATLFTPAAVFNNIEGPDREVLRSFDEPEWNNPVVRIIDADRSMLAPRIDGDYTVGGIAGAMVAALAKSGREVPPYLKLLAFEGAAQRSGTERATFAMHCFWEGEARLGAVEGVVSTTVGFLDGMEVVEAQFDPRTISFDELLTQARRIDCAHRVFTRSDAQQAAAARLLGKEAVRSDKPIEPSTKDAKYYLGLSPLRGVPMTGLQAARVNAALSSRADPAGLLSPSQVALAAELGKRKGASVVTMIGRDDIISAWAEARQVMVSRN